MSDEFYCKWCGQRFTDVRNLTANTCPRHPNKGRHELYEGSKKMLYTCKYCGWKTTRINALTANKCPRHPSGGRHEPAL